MPRTRRLAPVLMVLSLLTAMPAAASGGVDQEGARRALEGGEIHSLDEVLAAVRRVVPGDVIALKLRHGDKRWRYELKVLTPSGKRREVTIDASTLAILDDDDD